MEQVGRHRNGRGHSGLGWVWHKDDSARYLRGASLSEVRLIVQRFNPLNQQKPKDAEFAVPFRRGMTVLDAVLYARDYLDHSIGVRFSCRQASCGSCGMKINGKPRLACYTQVEELGGKEVRVGPMDNFQIVKDLVTDLGSFFDMHKSVSPYI